jgi:hypothetical protein
MLTEPLYQGLQDLGLHGMARAFAAQEESAQDALGFADRLALLIDAEQSARRNQRYTQRLRWARLGQHASLEDLDSRAPRGLDRRLIEQLASLAFVRDKLNLLITGPTGVGKSYLACALGQHACRENLGVRYLRPVHESWDGLVLPPDHPFWKHHYPPSGWGCRCYVLGARGDVSARAMGGDPNKPLPEGWETIDPKTGEQRGIDKGWGYMPGDTVSDAVSDMAAKTQQWDYTLAKAYMQDVPADTRDALATAYRDLPSTADDTRRYVQRVLSTETTADVPPYRTLGLATSKQVKEINALVPKTDVSGFDFALDRSAVLHIQAHHGTAATETPRGQFPVMAADYALLPQVLNAPDSIRRDDSSGIGRPVILIEKVIDGRKIMAAFEVRAGRKMLALQSLRIRKP